jgi:hypothetical protein
MNFQNLLSSWRLGVLAVFLLPRLALADAVVDRTVARYSAPELGDVAHPRFVLERTLAFEARLVVLAQVGAGIGDGYGERDARSAMDRLIAEEMLATLAARFVADAPADKRPSPQELDAVRQTIITATLESLGGRETIDQVARAEQLDVIEVNALLERSAMAAWYLDRAVTPLLHPGDEQLRDVYRTAEHPYRGRPFDQVRAPLERWFVLERVHVAESAFLQSARSRLRIVVTP